MYYLKMICNSAAVVFSTNCLRMKNKVMNSFELRSTIPGLIVQSIDDLDETLPIINYMDASCRSFDINTSTDRYQVLFPLEDIYFYDIVYLLLLVFSRGLNKRGKYIIHCAAVEKNGDCILIAGEPGAGKTSIALCLCLNYGYKLVSNDRTVIGLSNNRPYVFSGTLETSIRPQMKKLLFPHVKEDFWDKWDKKTDKINITDSFKELGVETGQKGFFKNIFLVNTYPSSEEGKIWEINRVDRSIAIVKMLSECIRGARNIMISNSQLLPSFDSKELMEIREQDVQGIISKCNCWCGRGAILSICDIINNLQPLPHN